MYAVVSPSEIRLPPGTVVRMPGTWQNYQDLLNGRGDHPMPRIKYCNGEIVLMSPLPVHGRDAHLLARVVECLLDHQGQNYEAFTPITMELPQKQGIDPDYCFYIDQWQAVVGKDRINWQIDPPPDLVIEIDVTSYTQVEDYVAYRVPEVWLLRPKVLTVYLLTGNRYIPSQSAYFPGIDVVAIAQSTFKQATEQGTGQAIRTLRQRLTSG